MADFNIQNLSFRYPGARQPALQDVTLTVPQGSVTVLLGPSGCGKTTLLRLLKPQLQPGGTVSGSILYGGKPVDTLSLRESSERIGFVQQNPEAQLVTDKVWHELAFGLESLGLETAVIRRRTAEMASFFGIQGWFHRSTAELSGGQKQLLNLAAVMVMQPEVLILDEPTSQLDPIAASEFLNMLERLNRELGTTIILSEHRLEQVLPMADQAVVLDCGCLQCAGEPRALGRLLARQHETLLSFWPAAMQVWAAVDGTGAAPLSIREGRAWLQCFLAAHTPKPLPPEQLTGPGDAAAIEAKDVWFRYEKDGADVVSGLKLQLRSGSFTALLGGNGTGKTTTLKLLAGLLQPVRGKIQRSGKTGLLPQDPQTLFLKNTLQEDLTYTLDGAKQSAEEKRQAVAEVVRLTRLEGLLDRHPYDLSGGEQQRAALAKLLLCSPDILLLDEPTRGMDAEFKACFAGILKELQRTGKTILMVSHDVEFCARFCDRCALFFDGAIAAEGTPREFFAGNSFYTTACSRMARGLVPGAVTIPDLIACLSSGDHPGDRGVGTETPDSGSGVSDDGTTAQNFSGVKASAPVRGNLSVPCRSTPDSRSVSMGKVFSDNLAAEIPQSDSTGDPADACDRSRNSLKAELGALDSSCRAARTEARQPEKQERTAEPEKLKKSDMRENAKKTEKNGSRSRRILSCCMILLLIPLTLWAGNRFFGGRKYYFISLLILLEALAPFFMHFEQRKPQARELVVLAVLCALGVAGRAIFFMLPQFKPVMALTIIAGAAMGAESGFLVGSMTMLASNMLFSQGPWTPWQMFAMGLTGFLAGVLFGGRRMKPKRLSMSIFGILAAIVIYGGIMNPASALMWSDTLNPGILLTYYISGFPMDCVQAAATAIFLWLLAEPMLEKLQRVQVKYGLPVFARAADPAAGASIQG